MTAFDNNATHIEIRSHLDLTGVRAEDDSGDINGDLFVIVVPDGVQTIRVSTFCI
jgi:hypothetical protein